MNNEVQVQLNRTLVQMEDYFKRMNDMQISTTCSCGLVTVKKDKDFTWSTCNTCGEGLECPSCNDHEYNKAPIITDEMETTHVINKTAITPRDTEAEKKTRYEDIYTRKGELIVPDILGRKD